MGFDSDDVTCLRAEQGRDTLSSAQDSKHSTHSSQRDLSLAKKQNHQIQRSPCELT
jgi:hypothetical protein